MEAQLKEDIRFLLGLIAGLRQLDEPGAWLLDLLREQLNLRQSMLEEVEAREVLH